MSARADRVSLVAGTALALLGCVLCLDQLDLISLSFGLAAALICAAAAVVRQALLISNGEGDRPTATLAATAFVFLIVSLFDMPTELRQLCAMVAP